MSRTSVEQKARRKWASRTSVEKIAQRVVGLFNRHLKKTQRSQFVFFLGVDEFFWVSMTPKKSSSTPKKSPIGTAELFLGVD